MKEGLALVLIGTVAGLVLGVVSARLLGSLLYGVGSVDTMTFLGAPAVLMAAGAFAAFLPARRASRVDPASVLRAE